MRSSAASTSSSTNCPDLSEALEEMNRVVPRLFNRSTENSPYNDCDDGPPAAKRRRVKKCNVVLEDVSRSKDFCVRSTYREAVQ